MKERFYFRGLSYFFEASQTPRSRQWDPWETPGKCAPPRPLPQCFIVIKFQCFCIKHPTRESKENTNKRDGISKRRGFNRIKNFFLLPRLQYNKVVDILAISCSVFPFQKILQKIRLQTLPNPASNFFKARDFYVKNILKPYYFFVKNCWQQGHLFPSLSDHMTLLLVKEKLDLSRGCQQWKVCLLF